MIDFTIKELLQCLNSLILNQEQLSIFKFNLNNNISDILIDSRKVINNSVFIAIKGDNGDGHQYLTSAKNNGALLAIVTQYDTTIDLPQLVVNNTRIALGAITKYLNTKWHKPKIVITGSCGKTSTKFILNSILKTNGEVLCAEASYNNDIGVPLTMFNANNQQWAGIFEIGTNNPGEISYLSNLITSNIAVLNNISASHIGNFENLEAIANEKSCIFEGLQSDGVAIFPYNSDYQDLILNKINNINKQQDKNIKYQSFGFTNKADIYADHINITATGSNFDLYYGDKSINIEFNLLGKHQVLNALAASLVALNLGLDLAKIKRGLEQLKSISKRMQAIKLTDFVTIIDDSYNASPKSAVAALEFLSQLPGKKILVLGDFRELGGETIPAHQELGHLARNLHIDKVFTLGEYSKYTLEAFNNNTGNRSNKFADKQDLVNNLLEYINNGDCFEQQCTILVKGANYSKMWEVSEIIQNTMSHI
jgi:UDP-N-acetylmuramoyl-tripeptide--D-alanyl-D-alanine ligase